MRSDQAKHLNHLARAARLAMSINELCEQPIITLRSQTTLAPCGQRLRADKRTGFAFQHVEIVIEVEHLLVAFLTICILTCCKEGAYAACNRVSGARGPEKTPHNEAKLQRGETMRKIA